MPASQGLDKKAQELKLKARAERLDSYSCHRIKIMRIVKFIEIYACCDESLTSCLTPYLFCISDLGTQVCNYQKYQD